MRGLKQDRNARVIIVGHALVRNSRRGHYELAVEADESSVDRRVRRTGAHAVGPETGAPRFGTPCDRTTQQTPQVRPWLLAWLGLPVLGIANGALRDATYKQATDELAAHQLSTATLLGLMTAYIRALQRRWPIRTSREAFTIGGSWALLTILFEFGFGHT